MIGDADSDGGDLNSKSLDDNECEIDIAGSVNYNFEE